MYKLSWEPEKLGGMVVRMTDMRINYLDIINTGGIIGQAGVMFIIHKRFGHKVEYYVQHSNID